jgi:hypothetical protein
MPALPIGVYAIPLCRKALLNPAGAWLRNPPVTILKVGKSLPVYIADNRSSISFGVICRLSRPGKSPEAMLSCCIRAT